jgi:hypothetical protein
MKAYSNILKVGMEIHSKMWFYGFPVFISGNEPTLDLRNITL